MSQYIEYFTLHIMFSLFHSLFASYDFFFVKADRASDMEFSA